MKLHTISRARGLAWAAENIRYHASPGLTLSCGTAGKIIQCRNYQGKKNTKIVIADLSLHCCLVLQSTIPLFTSHTQVFVTHGMKLFPVTTNNAIYYNASRHNCRLRNFKGRIKPPKAVRGHATYIDSKLLSIVLVPCFSLEQLSTSSGACTVMTSNAAVLLGSHDSRRECVVNLAHCTGGCMVKTNWRFEQMPPSHSILKVVYKRVLL